MVGYNQLQFIEYYKKRAEIQRIKLDTGRLNTRIQETGFNGPVVMDRSEYQHPSKRSFAMFFEDGKLPEWHKSIQYDLNQMYIRFPKLFDPDSSVEVIKFHNMNNSFHHLTSKIIAPPGP